MEQFCVVHKLPDGQEYYIIEFGSQRHFAENSQLQYFKHIDYSGPKFILGCTISKKTPDDIYKEVNYSFIDCQYPSSALALDGSSNVEAKVLEMMVFLLDKEIIKKSLSGYYSY